MNVPARHALVAIAIVVLALVLYVPAFSNGHGWAMDDFKTFYCSGRVLLEGENPYDTIPLAACESQPAPRPIFVARPGFVLPAPLPGYAIAGFAIVALVPFLPAVFLWICALLAATLASITLLSRLTSANVWAIAAAFSTALVAISFAVGELVPICLLGIVLTAWAVYRTPPTRAALALAGCGVALAFAEPQVGAAVAIACALVSWRFAISTGVAIAALTIISLAVLGIAGNVAYVRDVLPAHVLSELPAYFQYSLSWLLNRLGMPAGLALSIGQLQWITMLVATGLFARAQLARAHPEIAVLAAPAFAVTGGPFLHLDHVALALPAAIWLAASSPKPSAWQTAAIIALAVPLLQLLLLLRWIPLDVILAFIVVVAAWLGFAFGRSLRACVYSASAATLFVAAVAVSLVVGGFGFVTPATAQALPSAMPQASWAHFVATHYVMTAWPVWLVKAPTWFGIAATASGLIVAAYTAKRDIAAPPVHGRDVGDIVAV